MFSFSPWYIHSGDELLGCVVTPCLTTWWIARHFLKWSRHLTLPPALCEESNFSISSATLILCLLDCIHPTGCDYLVVLICTSLMANHGEHHFRRLLLIIYISSWRMVCSDLLSIFYSLKKVLGNYEVLLSTACFCRLFPSVYKMEPRWRIS